VTKKEILTIEREKEKLDKVLGGIRDMNHLPTALFIVDSKKESIAVMEAKRLNITTFALNDTNADPDFVDYPVPCNDDAFKSISLLTRAIAEAILEGKSGRIDMQMASESEGSEAELAYKKEHAESAESYSSDAVKK